MTPRPPGAECSLLRRVAAGRCSRRALLGALAAACVGSGALVWSRRDAQRPTSADREAEAFVRAYLARTRAYDDVITGIEVRGQRLRVFTNLGAPGSRPRPAIADQPRADAPPGLGSADREGAREIYDLHWREIVLAHPEAGIFSVVILDWRGGYLDGGQGYLAPSGG